MLASTGMTPRRCSKSWLLLLPRGDRSATALRAFFLLSQLPNSRCSIGTARRSRRSIALLTIRYHMREHAQNQKFSRLGIHMCKACLRMLATRQLDDDIQTFDIITSRDVLASAYARAPALWIQVQNYGRCQTFPLRLFSGCRAAVQCRRPRIHKLQMPRFCKHPFHARRLPTFCNHIPTPIIGMLNRDY